MPTLENLQQQINQIQDRNKKVETDKAWETSLTRKGILIILSYIVIVIFFLFAKLPDPFTNAIVPALAFVISTLTVPLFKNYWVKNYYQKK